MYSRPSCFRTLNIEEPEEQTNFRGIQYRGSSTNKATVKYFETVTFSQQTNGNRKNDVWMFRRELSRFALCILLSKMKHLLPASVTKGQIYRKKKVKKLKWKQIRIIFIHLCNTQYIILNPTIQNIIIMIII